MNRIACCVAAASLACFFAGASPAIAGGVFTQIYAFTGGADGALPLASVTLDSLGNIYGETDAGAELCSLPQVGVNVGGCGTLFKITPSGQITTLLSFDGANGAAGLGQPLLVGNTLYATTFEGGTDNKGVIFSLQTDGTGYQLLHQFSGNDGANPIGSLIPARGGGVYGTAYGGGYGKDKSVLGYGTLFKLGPNGKLMTLHAFNGKDGINPHTILVDAAGILYGSTEGGGSADCGTIFSFTPSTSTFKTLYSFTCKRDGDLPSLGSIDSAGTLYGATYSSGPYNQGTLFSLSTTVAQPTPTLLHGFDKGAGPDGFNPLSGPTLLPNGTLIGTTSTSIYLFDTSLVFNGTTLETVLNSYYENAQPVIGPNGSVIGPLVNGPADQSYATRCFSSSGQIINYGSCGVIYSETYSH